MNDLRRRRLSIVVRRHRAELPVPVWEAAACKRIDAFLDETDCTCEVDEVFGCWYHLSDEEQNDRIVRHLHSVLND